MNHSLDPFGERIWPPYNNGVEVLQRGSPSIEECAFVQTEGSFISSAEREDEIREAIRQIDEAFRSTGGADGTTEPVPDLDP